MDVMSFSFVILDYQSIFIHLFYITIFFLQIKLNLQLSQVIHLHHI